MNYSFTCRFCSGHEADCVVNLGQLHLTGYFPSSPSEVIPNPPIEIMLCRRCGLAQLSETTPLDQLYGDNYGYRSGLNRGMISHLVALAARAAQKVELLPGDVVLDIGSNDGTLLRGFSKLGITKIGIDPSAKKFREFYESDTLVLEDFFSHAGYTQVADSPAKIITSIAMLYDLPNPAAFFEDIRRVLHPDGLWITEQSYAPWMLRTGAFDTICHEHLEYYTLKNLELLCVGAGLKIASAGTNSVNGGSLRLEIVHGSSSRGSDDAVTRFLRRREELEKVSDAHTWHAFGNRIWNQTNSLAQLLEDLVSVGSRISALGASTKGNVLLQLIPNARDLIQEVGDVNPFKFGRFTPGTNIPIVSQEQALATKPDYVLILPWHFRKEFIQDLLPDLMQGLRLIFPLPELEIFEL